MRIEWMDVRESRQALRKHRAVEIQRAPLVPAQENNEFITTRRPRTREISSRYTSPSRATLSGPGRCPSPNPTRTTLTSSKLIPKRAQSAERKWPTTPPSPTSPSTPVHESSVDVHSSSRRITGNNLQESLWPPTMRSVSVSFQSDAMSIPVSKKEKPNSSASGCTLWPTSNLAHKLAETPTVLKLTPEGKRSPLKGKTASDHSENSKPVDGLQSRLIDQHRWPSSIGGKVSSNATNRSVDLADKSIRILNSSFPRTGVSSLRRLSSWDEANKPLQKSISDTLSLSNETNKPLQKFISDTSSSSNEENKPLQKSVSDTLSLLNEANKPLQKSVSDTLCLSDEANKPLQKLISDTVKSLSMVESDRIGNEGKSVNDSLLHVLRPLKFVSACPSDKTASATLTVGSKSSPTPKSCPASPFKTSVLYPSSARGVSPSQSRPSTAPSRGVSPSRIRPTNSFSETHSSISVLSFIADLKKGKKCTSHIDDAHQLRLLYNRCLQWRFANAREEIVLYIQNAIAEKALNNVWNATLSLWDSVIRKRINLHQLKLELKLNSVLNDQIAYLENWALLERDHVDALAGAVEDLEANTLRLPVTGGARADIEHLKVAICSAVDVMQAMGSAICSWLSRVEGMHNLVYELAVVAAQEKAMLDECEALLASAAAMKVEENSLRTHLMQIKQALGKQGG